MPTHPTSRLRGVSSFPPPDGSFLLQISAHLCPDYASEQADARFLRAFSLSQRLVSRELDRVVVANGFGLARLAGQSPKIDTRMSVEIPADRRRRALEDFHLDVLVARHGNAIDDFDGQRGGVETRDLEAPLALVDLVAVHEADVAGFFAFVAHHDTDALVLTEGHAHVGARQHHRQFAQTYESIIAEQLHLA